MAIKLERIRKEDKGAFKKRLLAYLSEIEAGDNGVFDYPYLDLYWTEPDRLPFNILFQSKGSVLY